ncbi:MAG: general secretion pathway protein GspB [Sideroxyarcus sp.]|nr:general secretion pathway protein GspB [Sideroxyarcus sp.]
MSYILEALKKSDQQRQRGATPTLPPVHAAVAAHTRSSSVYYGVLAAVLLFAGIAIGWLRPWQADRPVHAVETVVARPAIPNPDRALPAPQPDLAVTDGKPEQTLTAPVAPSIATNEPASTGQEQKATPFSDLPPAIQQEMPDMKIQLHSYSNKSTNSIVSINSRMMKEGDSLVPGLKLEQITPDGVILSFKGYRFWHGIY